MANKTIDPAEKLRTVHQILDGKELQSHAASRLGIRMSSLQQWISIYKSDGEGAFLSQKPKCYSRELKEQAVLDYLCGRGSQQEICQRYGIRARSKLHNWIKRYNSHDEFKLRSGGSTVMTKTRKTTEEVFEIVKTQLTNLGIF